MVKNDVSFILSFVILMAKMWIFRLSPGVCPMELSNLVFSLGCLVSNGRRALLGGIRLGGSATRRGLRTWCVLITNEDLSRLQPPHTTLGWIEARRPPPRRPRPDEGSRGRQI